MAVAFEHRQPNVCGFYTFVLPHAQSSPPQSTLTHMCTQAWRRLENKSLKSINNQLYLLACRVEAFPDPILFTKPFTRSPAL